MGFLNLPPVSRKMVVSCVMKLALLLLLFPPWVFPDAPNIILINMDDMGWILKHIL